MSRDSVPIRGLLISGLCLLLALLLGYLLATPLEYTSFSLVGLVFCVLLLPLFLRWHHSLLIISWNAALIVFFLPGQPSVGLILGAASLFVSIVTRTLTQRRTFISYPPVSYPLIFLAGVVVVTMFATGGLTGRAFGSETWGGKRYVEVLGAIIGYFALVARPIRPQSAVWLASLFFLSGVTAVISDLAYAAGPSFYFLFILFSSGVAATQAHTETTLLRFAGLALAAQAFCCFMLLRYGIREIFNWRHFWRLLFFASVSILGLFGGFRSTVILFCLMFAIQFYFERLFRSSLFLVLLLSGILLGSMVVSFATRLPMPVQRSLSFLPIEVHPLARQDAVNTLDWRLQMWKVVLPDVPQYLLRGKGYGFSSTDFLLTQMAMQRGLFTAYEDTLITGNYHNGILTLIIPFGIWGAGAFAFFCWGALRALYANYRYGIPELHRINTFLLAYFLARLVFYVVFYGQFDLDLMIFIGTVGLSITLNGGVRRKEVTIVPCVPQSVVGTTRLQTA